MVQVFAGFPRAASLLLLARHATSSKKNCKDALVCSNIEHSMSVFPTPGMDCLQARRTKRARAGGYRGRKHSLSQHRTNQERNSYESQPFGPWQKCCFAPDI